MTDPQAHTKKDTHPQPLLPGAYSEIREGMRILEFDIKYVPPIFINVYI